jgi:RecA/RadA recombinase
MVDFNVEEEQDLTASETEELLESVSLNPPKKKGPKPKKDIPAPEEIKQSSDSELLNSLDSKTKELYLEFNSFLEKKTEMVPDKGIKETISTNINLLDAIMGGGFAIGTLGVVTGQPGSGKSMLAIQSLAAAQKKYSGNILTSYLDSEESTTTARMSNLGVRFPKLKPYTDITIEKVFKFLEGVCLFKEQRDIVDIPSVIVWDSVANTLSQKEREVEDINSAIGYKARVLSILIPKYVPKLSMFNISLIAVNQLRDVISIGPYQAPRELKFMSSGKDMPGGTTLKFNAFHLLEMNIKGIVKEEMYGFSGIIVRTKCVKNKLFVPNIEIELIGDFVTGFSNFWTNYKFLVDNKRLESGAWNFLLDLPEKKFRTKDAPELYETDSKFKEFYDKAVQETIQTEIIDKYKIEE